MGNLLLQVILNLLDEGYLLVDHVVDSLPHSPMPLLPPLRLLVPLMPLLRAQSLDTASIFHFFLVREILFFVVFEVLFDVCGNLGQILQLGSYLLIDLVQVIQLHAYFVNLHLVPKGRTRVPPFLQGRSEAPTVAISAAQGGPESTTRSGRDTTLISLGRLLLVGHVPILINTKK